MITKILISIFMWIVYLLSGTSILVALFFLFKILILEKLRKAKRKSPYQNKEILEEDPFGKKR